ncbi:MAG: PG0541 family transporter-associated protein [Bacteroidales bacterium]|jgi:nitrogen regulatory protein PII
MKAVLIVFNQALTQRVEYMLDMLKIKGFTFWEQVQGRGSNDGEPRRGTHTWPEMNSSILTVLEDEKQIEDLLLNIKKLNSVNYEVGIRAFVWDVIKTV